MITQIVLVAILLLILLSIYIFNFNETYFNQDVQSKMIRGILTCFLYLIILITYFYFGLKIAPLPNFYIGLLGVFTFFVYSSGFISILYFLRAKDDYKEDMKKKLEKGEGK